MEKDTPPPHFALGPRIPHARPYQPSEHGPWYASLTRHAGRAGPAVHERGHGQLCAPAHRSALTSSPRATGRASRPTLSPRSQHLH
jgi:hypothetical protein